MSQDDKPTDLNTQILIDIRDEMKLNRQETSTLRGEMTTLGETLRGEMTTLGETLRGEMAALRRQQVETEVRLATELTAVSGVLIDIRDHLVAQSTIEKRVERCELGLGILDE